MAGIRSKSGPPGNQNAFRHGLAGISQRGSDNNYEAHPRGLYLTPKVPAKGSTGNSNILNTKKFFLLLRSTGKSKPLLAYVNENDTKHEINPKNQQQY
jgi:hypothetical protein